MKRQSRSGERRNREPLYLQIATALRRDIAGGILRPHAQLPAISEAAAIYKVAVFTIRQAIEVLEEEGLLERFQGRGTFVAAEPGIGRQIALKSDWASLLTHADDGQSTSIGVADKIAMPALDPALGVADGDYRFMRRVHSSDGVPYALIDIYLSQRVYDRDPVRFDEGTVISGLSDMPDVEIGCLRQRISFTTADPETAGLLELPVNSPIGNVLRVIADTDGKAVYVGLTKYRGDFVNLEFDLAGAPR